MVRVKNGIQRHSRHKAFIARAKGFRLGRNNLYKQVRLALVKQGQHAYISRKLKKRDYRQLWIERINAAVQQKGTSYSRFISTMTKKNVQLNRKVLSNIAATFPAAFDAIFNEIAQ
jgi:large subunit ribosomal protein L20